jgi:MFS family permease
MPQPWNTKWSPIPEQTVPEPLMSALSTPPKKPAGKLRWLMIFMAFSATAINYIDRANLGVAMPFIKEELDLSDADAGYLLGAFFWTYALFQLPSGWFIDKVGARIAYSVAVVWWSFFTAIAAFVNGFASLFGARLLLGIGEAPAYPTNAKIAAEWFPRQERAIAASIFDSGNRVGTALSLPIVSFIIATVGWRMSFIITGLLGFFWTAIWLRIYRTPAEHPDITPEEREYIQQGQPPVTRTSAPAADTAGNTSQPAPASLIAPALARFIFSESASDLETACNAAKSTLSAALDESRAPQSAEPTIRWVDLFKHRTIWGMMLGFFCLNFVIYFFSTWFPTYLKRELAFDLKTMGATGMIPALVAVVGGYIGGYVSDRLVRSGMPLTRARKIPLTLGMLASSSIGFIVLIDNAREHVSAVIALMSLSYASLSFTAASIWSLPADVAPTRDHVGSIGGIQNFASNMAGVCITTFVGVMLSKTGSFTAPLVVAGAFAVLGAFSYLFIVPEIKPIEIGKTPQS